MDYTALKIIRSLVDHPSADSSAELDLLEQTIKEYPYFHTAYLLLTHARKRTDAGLWTDALPRIALHVRNRRLLHQTFRDIQFQTNTGKDTDQVAETIHESVPEAPAQTVEETPFYFQSDTTLSPSSDAPSETPAPLKTGTRLDVIERFLEHPRITPPDKDTDFKANISESLQENGELATETLAGIYVDQGYIKKALGVYKILILKYPEKSSYFASQIEKLEQELI